MDYLFPLNTATVALSGLAVIAGTAFKHFAFHKKVVGESYVYHVLPLTYHLYSPFPPSRFAASPVAVRQRSRALTPPLPPLRPRLADQREVNSSTTKLFQ